MAALVASFAAHLRRIIPTRFGTILTRLGTDSAPADTAGLVAGWVRETLRPDADPTAAEPAGTVCG